MIRGFVSAVGAVLLLSFTVSCRTSSDVVLTRLSSDALPPGEAATVRGMLVRSGPCLAVQGNGTTVIIWVRAAAAETRGGGTVVVIWPRGRASGPPIRTGEEVEMAGIIVTIDNITGYARVPDDPGCRSARYLVVRDARPTA